MDELLKKIEEANSDQWTKLKDELKGLAGFETRLLLFAKTLDGEKARKFNSARKAFEKATDDLVDAMSDVK